MYITGRVEGHTSPAGASMFAQGVLGLLVLGLLVLGLLCLYASCRLLAASSLVSTLVTGVAGITLGAATMLCAGWPLFWPYRTDGFAGSVW